MRETGGHNTQSITVAIFGTRWLDRTHRNFMGFGHVQVCDSSMSGVDGNRLHDTCAGYDLPHIFPRFGFDFFLVMSAQSI